MEIVLILAVLAFGLWFFFLREKATDQSPVAPYKVETPTPAADVAPQPVQEVAEPVQAAPVVVDNQITDAVTQEAPAKKPRKPRTPKAEKPAKEKAAKPKKAAAIKAKPKATKSKKV